MQNQSPTSQDSDRRHAPAILATRNQDATMHLVSLEWEPLADGTLLFECRDGSTPVNNLCRDSFCWVVVHRGRLPAQRPDEAGETHLVGKGFVEAVAGASDGTEPDRVVIRFQPDGYCLGS
jgi:hypothetical protein